MVFPKVIYGDLELYNKSEASFQIIENAVSIFKSNKKVPLVVIDIGSDELNWPVNSVIIKNLLI